MEDVGRIAILNAAALGDLVQILPAAEALRARYPRALITLLGRSWHAELVESRPGPFDEVIAVPDRAIGDQPVRFDPAERQRFVDALRGRFDIALQMHGGGRHSNPLIRGLSARVAAGARTPDAVPLDRWIPYDLYQPNVLRAVEIASLVGAEFAPLEPLLAVTESDVDASRQVVPADGRPLVIVHPGASDSRRRWPATNFAEVADALVEAGARVVLTGTAGEQPVVDAVKTAARYDLDDLCEKLSMPALVGVLARAALVVSNDTGPRHLAAAVGTATVAIYWVGNVLTAGPLTRGRHQVVMSWRLDCPVCGRNCIGARCGHRDSFVADVPMRTVRRRALDLLDSEVAYCSAARDVAPRRDRVPA